MAAFAAHNTQMTATVKRDKLLETLRTNRANHGNIVKEAREGYVKEAQRRLEGALGRLREGKIVALDFQLHVPEDYTSAYDTAIAMLEWNTHDEVELTASDFRQYVQDNWDFIDRFLISNSRYSTSAAAYATSKGLDV